MMIIILLNITEKFNSSLVHLLFWAWSDICLHVVSIFLSFSFLSVSFFLFTPATTHTHFSDTVPFSFHFWLFTRRGKMFVHTTQSVEGGIEGVRPSITSAPPPRERFSGYKKTTKYPGTKTVCVSFSLSCVCVCRHSMYVDFLGEWYVLSQKVIF